MSAELSHTTHDPDRLFVVVLGAHRSGTSLCAHVLSALGIDMADDPTPQPSNPKGHWERWEIVAFHDRILELFNRGYRTPLHDLPMPLGWWADRRVSDIKKEIMSFLARRMVAGVPFGFKDPRTARLLRLWKPIFSELDRQVKILVCLRNPVQVARSLQERDGLPLDMGEYRWFSYMMEIFANLSNDYCTIEYEAWFDRAGDNAAKLIKFLSLDARKPVGAAAVIGEIVDRQLRHDDVGLQSPRQPLVRAFYEAFRRLDADVAARMQLARMVHQSNQYRDLQQCLASEFEAASRVAAGSARLVPTDGEAPIVSWRTRQMTKPIGAESRGDSTITPKPDPIATVVPNSPTANPPVSATRALVFVRYDSVPINDQTLMLWYRAGELSARSEVEQKLSVSLRWFHSGGRVLVWRSNPVPLDLSETAAWRQVAVSVPPFPRRTPWLRFEILATDQPNRPPLCTGFLFARSDRPLPPEMDGPVFAYTHAVLQPRPPDDSIPSSTDAAPMLAAVELESVSAVPAVIPRGRPFFIEIASLYEAGALVFVDCDCLGRRLLTAQLPPPALSPGGSRLVLPAVGPDARIFRLAPAGG